MKTGEEPLDAARVFAPEQRTVPVMLRRQAERYDDKKLVQAGEIAWSFTEVPEVAARAAGRLRSAGIGAGDRVALMCSNRPEFIAILLGCGWLGAVLVPI